MKKFELTMRHTVAIVSYIAASMGYSKEEIKYIAGNMKFGSDDIGEFQEILAEPLDDIHSVKYNGEVKDLVGSFNLAERIQMVIDLILKKSNLEDGDDLPMKSYLSATVSAYKNSPFKFSNFIRNPEEEPGMTAHEEYLVDEAVRKATEETLRELKGEEVEIPNFKFAPDVASDEDSSGSGQSSYFKTKLNIFGRRNPQMGSNFVPVPHAYWSSKHFVNEIDEINQVIDNLISFRDRLIANLGHAQFKEKEQPEQPNINWDDVQKAEEQPKPFQKAQEQPKPIEPVKFTEEQRQRQREILGNPFGTTSRYDQIGNDKVKKLNEYVIRSNSGNKYVPYSFLSPLDDKPLFDQMLHDRTETEAMISRSIEIYPSTNLCKDSLDVNNLKELFSFVRIDGDRLYRINDSSVQPWNRNKPLGSVRLVKGDFGLFNAIKFIVKVDEDAIKEYVDKYFDDPLVILEAFNDKYGLFITPEDIAVDSSFETPSQYLFRCSYYRVADELKESLKKDRIKLIKGLVRNSAIAVMVDKELQDWLKGKNPTNS